MTIHTTKASTGFDRRAFLASTAAGLGVLAAPALGIPARPRERRRAGPSCRNVIFMVADGMSTGTLTLADLSRRRHHGRASNWVELWKRPGVKRASAFTASADSPVTDSAAGGSAWGCGRHVNNEVLNITPDGASHEPILLRAQRSGKAIGVVTTTRVTHATPASFYANHPRRDFEPDVAHQLVERRLDVAFGGGEKYFTPGVLGATPPTVLRTTADLRGYASAPAPGPVLGLFASEHIPHVLDRSPDDATLPEMSRVALQRLAQGPQGFVLQIEGGRVDHAAHANDAGSLLAEQIEFDDAVGVALDFMRDRDDTLLILTTDHGNANPGLTFYGKGACDRFDRLPHVKHSLEWVFENLNARTAESLRTQLRDLTHQAAGIDLSDTEADMVAGAMKSTRVSPFAAAGTPINVLGAILADSLGVAFLSPNHTSDLVEVTALGPGCESLPMVIDNVDLWTLMVGVLALEPAKSP